MLHYDRDNEDRLGQLSHCDFFNFIQEINYVIANKFTVGKKGGSQY